LETIENNTNIQQPANYEMLMIYQMYSEFFKRFSFIRVLMAVINKFLGFLFKFFRAFYLIAVKADGQTPHQSAWSSNQFSIQISYSM